jgi:hypothetical protein
MKKQHEVHRIPIRTFIVVPEQCPGELEITCDCCEHTGKEFQVVKPAPGSDKECGFVTCYYTGHHSNIV